MHSIRHASLFGPASRSSAKGFVQLPALAQILMLPHLSRGVPDLREIPGPQMLRVVVVKRDLWLVSAISPVQISSIHSFELIATSRNVL
jgi:hypothetical protein